LKKSNTNTFLFLSPLLGICLYILIYLVATYLFPGGSDFDKSALGFSWRHNYWCELLAEKAPNGAVNTARPVAIFGMFVLAASLIMFWYLFSILFTDKGRLLIRYTGLLSMVIALFLFAGPHDLVMIVSGLLGLFALAMCLVILYRQKKYWLVFIGWFCIGLCALNNYIYYTGVGFNNLAFIQKITFVFFFYWFIAVNFYMFRMKKELQ
jgi:uncharacterized membrane protein HdeD (DUF308 family)